MTHSWARHDRQMVACMLAQPKNLRRAALFPGRKSGGCDRIFKHWIPNHCMRSPALPQWGEGVRKGGFRCCYSCMGAALLVV